MIYETGFVAFVAELMNGQPIHNTIAHTASVMAWGMAPLLTLMVVVFIWATAKAPAAIHSAQAAALSRARTARQRRDIPINNDAIRASLLFEAERITQLPPRIAPGDCIYVLAPATVGSLTSSGVTWDLYSYWERRRSDSTGMLGDYADIAQGSLGSVPHVELADDAMAVHLDARAEKPFIIYKCKITNYGQLPIINVWLPFTMQYERQAVESGGRIVTSKIGPVRRAEVYIPKIDFGPASAFTFYACNESEQDYNVIVTVPESATVELLDDPVPKSIRLSRSRRSEELVLLPVKTA